ncbi:MAG TPA: response regulator [Burkholderiaceae bacterium]|nr:response regulator [Burkholderiaceae bacterium]
MDSFELGELFMHAVRQVLPIARAKGLTCLADCEPLPMPVGVSATELRQSLHALFCAAIDALDSGFIFFSAEMHAAHGGGHLLEVHAAGTGLQASPVVVDSILEELGLRDDILPIEAGAGIRSARGICASASGQLSFLSMPPEGVAFALRLPAPLALERSALPEAPRGARAWILSEEPRWSQLLVRRLQRLGWAVSMLTSTHEALLRVKLLRSRSSAPLLVLGLASADVHLEGMEALQAYLPPHSRVVLGMDDADHLAEMGASGRPTGIEVRPFPFSPGDLLQFTSSAAEHALDATTRSGLTEPAPLAFEDRPRVLVVDDNPVNQLVAGGMLQALGFEVDLAADGEEAIARCQAHAPDAVLMDVHMPVLDGLEATRRLRAMQRSGALRLFPIIASTAADGHSARRRCLDAGMDAYLGKPLSLMLLESEIRRMLPAAA